MAPSKEAIRERDTALALAEGRLRVLNEKAEEARREWTRAEREWARAEAAEAERDLLSEANHATELKLDAAEKLFHDEAEARATAERLLAETQERVRTLEAALREAKAEVFANDGDAKHGWHARCPFCGRITKQPPEDISEEMLLASMEHESSCLMVLAKAAAPTEDAHDHER